MRVEPTSRVFDVYDSKNKSKVVRCGRERVLMADDDLKVTYDCSMGLLKVQKANKEIGRTFTKYCPFCGRKV